MTASKGSFELMLDCLPPTELEEACLAFSNAGSQVPSVIWSPGKRQFLHPLIERFAQRCSQLCRADGFFHAHDVNPADFGTLADWMMILRIDPEAGKLVYAHYGDGIADHFGRNMTGKTTDDFGGHISNFFNAVYQEVKRRRAWVLTEHEPPKQIFVCAWRRLVVPLLGTHDDVTGFIAINVPESPLRAGLDLVPEPIFVLDSSLDLRFANTFARTLFALQMSGYQGVNFSDLTGIDLSPSVAPEEMFARSTIDNQVVHLQIADRLEDDFLVTVSGAIHSGNSFYIVMLRMLTSKEHV